MPKHLTSTLNSSFKRFYCPTTSVCPFVLTDNSLSVGFLSDTHSLFKGNWSFEALIAVLCWNFRRKEITQLEFDFTSTTTTLLQLSLLLLPKPGKTQITFHLVFSIKLNISVLLEGHVPSLHNYLLAERQRRMNKLDQIKSHPLANTQL